MLAANFIGLELMIPFVVLQRRYLPRDRGLNYIAICFIKKYVVPHAKAGSDGSLAMIKAWSTERLH